MNCLIKFFIVIITEAGDINGEAYPYRRLRRDQITVNVNTRVFKRYAFISFNVALKVPFGELFGVFYRKFAFFASFLYVGSFAICIFNVLDIVRFVAWTFIVMLYPAYGSSRVSIWNVV